MAQKFGTSFPYGTVLINLTGSFAMGLLTTLVVDQVLFLSPELRLLTAVGFLGSYTTFSTFEIDTITLVSGAGLNIATFYWLGSAIAGSLSLYLGIVVARLMR